MAATHLGEVRDMPPRSLDALREAALLVFEEDRPARSFLKAAGVHRDYYKYTEHREAVTLEAVEAALRKKEHVLYMSDQGTPGLSDPGRDLVQLAYKVGAKVRVIPGPSSLTAAVAACPFDCSSFQFLGFPPREDPDRVRVLKEAAGRRPLIMMDTPYRLKALLASCDQAFGKGRRGFVAMDVSGPREDYWVGSFTDLAQKASRLDEKLNFVLIIEGS